MTPYNPHTRTEEPNDDVEVIEHIEVIQTVGPCGLVIPQKNTWYEFRPKPNA